MPVDPTSFTANTPVTAKAMNTALYTYSPGNNFTGNGILFHAQRPLLVESMTAAMNQASSTTGTYTSLNSAGKWTNWYDNGVLLGGGADFQANFATGQLKPAVPGSSGTAGSVGGYYLIWGFPFFAATTNANCSGSGLDENGTTVPGGHQLSSTARTNCSYAMDLIAGASGQANFLQGYCADASGSNFAYQVNTTDYSGTSSRFYGVWMGASTGTVLTSVPTPDTWSSTSTVTAAKLNNDITAAMQLLNYPPLLRAGNAPGTSITANTQTKVPLSTAQIDTYAKFTSGTNTYTVPLDGVYLAHGVVSYNSSSTGAVYAGISVNGGTGTFGPAYSAPSANSVGANVTVLLDLHAGDTVTLVTLSTVTQTLATGALSRLVLAWMGTLAGSSGSVSWTPPSTGFRWQAGTPGTSLISQFQTHLTNDVGFLLQRPYLLANQGTAQTGLAQNTIETITMDTVQGLIHTSAGDNYGGWTSGASNHYSAVRSGWYLVLGKYSQTALSVTASLVGYIKQTPAGSVTPDVYQHISATSSALLPGAEAIGVYYLRAGDQIQPQYQQQDGSATYSTAVTTGHRSTFGCIWLCE